MEQAGWNGARYVNKPNNLKPKQNNKLKKCIDCPVLIKSGKRVRCGPCSDVYKEKKNNEFKLLKIHENRQQAKLGRETKGAC